MEIDLSSKNWQSIQILARKLESGLPNHSSWGRPLLTSDCALALDAVEAELSKNPDSLEVRLWWVHCQLVLERVPAAALSAPLEEVSKKLASESGYRKFGAFVFLQMACRLCIKKQYRLAIRMFEHALELEVLEPQASQEILLLLEEVIKSEQELAAQRREGKKYQEVLDKKLEKIIKEQKRFSKRKKKTAERKEKPPQRLTAKSLFALGQAEGENQGVEKEITNVHLVDEAQSTVLDDEHAPLPAIEELEEIKQKNNLFFFLLAFGLFILGGYYFFSSTDSPELEPRLAMTILGEKTPSLILPELSTRAVESKSIDGTDSRSNLKRVTERLKNLSVQNDEIDSSESELLSEEVSQEPESLSEEDVVLEDEGYEPSLSSSENVPYLNLEKLAASKKESIGSDPRGTVVNGLVRNPDGRLYGPPQTLDEVKQRDASRVGLGGGTVASQEVQEFAEPVVYRVIASTNVLSAPSLLAVSYARLETGAKVQVVSQMGHWLELRSSGGKRGYIYSQDAVLD